MEISIFVLKMNLFYSFIRLRLSPEKTFIIRSIKIACAVDFQRDSKKHKRLMTKVNIQ